MSSCSTPSYASQASNALSLAYLHSTILSRPSRWIYTSLYFPLKIVQVYTSSVFQLDWLIIIVILKLTFRRRWSWFGCRRPPTASPRWTSRPTRDQLKQKVLKVDLSWTSDGLRNCMFESGQGSWKLKSLNLVNDSKLFCHLFHLLERFTNGYD